MRVVAAVAAVALSLGTAAFGQQSSAQPRPIASSGKAPLDTVTVEAQRERKEVEREVNEFVFAVTVRSLHDSLSRWNTPICPLVAGLPKEQGEFVLARLSQIARESKAPLAGEHPRAVVRSETTAAALTVSVPATLRRAGCPYTITLSAQMKQP